MSKGLSEEEAGREMKKMVAFIMQEAHEKAREIHVKADEEYAIEKAKLVRADSEAVEAQHARRLKQAEVKRRIAHSAHHNRARLQLLQAQDAVMDDVVAQARDALAALADDAAPAGVEAYAALLKDLVVQCLARLSPDGADIVVREKDVALLQRVLPGALAAFASLSGASPPLSICGGSPGSAPGRVFLPPECAGGVRASALAGRVLCDNTLETRLAHAYAAQMPRVRHDVFGPSASRRFFD